jgi:hypothetical protein
VTRVPSENFASRTVRCSDLVVLSVSHLVLFIYTHVGGGRRCDDSNCDKLAQGGSKFCPVHGLDRQCRFDECDKRRLGDTSFCKTHAKQEQAAAQGTRCLQEDCTVVVTESDKTFCSAHCCGYHGCTNGGSVTLQAGVCLCTEHLVGITLNRYSVGV